MGLRDFKQEVRRIEWMQGVLTFFLKIRNKKLKEAEQGEKSKQVW